MTIIHKSDQKIGVLFFVKYPIKGQVKSRLSAHLEPVFLLTLYQCFVTDIVTMLYKTRLPILLCFSPSIYEQKFRQWIPTASVYIPQNGKSLGERMKNGFIDGFNQGFTTLLVIGSDSPDLKPKIISQAVEKLNHYDAVIGPSADGGYYLFGLHKETFSAGFFENIKWSTNTVYETTLQKLHDDQKSVFSLPMWYDIDTIEDLKKLYQLNQTTSFTESETMRLLNQYFK
ncbi:MAG: TIGR04282 family arsenosugar biosynthesis glycosyltransferase [Candidatus Thermoplasmatota archaeon]|nr:TIGR04282 family arsenosugar biosynthesis glycosyltransferase [Candidatus Thermoplasmatota archaeon]MBU1941887.1 TIGR04282 family arsenosugar biosynthesis glycosyltransferase [Candidatus Thermoplasmatota archaeon]